jgi:threonine aldolase
MTTTLPPTPNVFTLDLRSDTVTRPTAAMRQAMANADVGDDVLDGDPTTRRLEAVVAERLGKESALFFPSGTMANQTAVWLLSAPGTEILVDPLSHVVHWEAAALAALCGVQPLAVVSDAPVMSASALASAIRLPSAGGPEPSMVCLENTHAWAGGVITGFAELRAMRDVATRHALPVHLDGARLWNAAVASGTSVAAFSTCADTVMVSFSKGLGAPVGSALAGSRALMQRAVRVRERFGGAMRQSGILAAAALHGLEHHMAQLERDHEAAQELARLLTAVPEVSVVAPDTNIVMIDLPSPCAAQVAEQARALGVLVSDWTPSRIRAVTHLDAPLAMIPEAGSRLVRALEKALASPV